MEEKDRPSQPQVSPQPPEQINDSSFTSPKINIPKTFSKYREIKGMIFGLCLLVFGIGFAVYVHGRTHSTKDLLVILGGFGGVGLIVLLISVISYLQLRKSADNNPQFNQFQASTAVNYVTPKGIEAAKVYNDEKILDWFGPVNRSDFKGQSYGILDKEVDKQTANTLLFTNRQIIALMLGPEDAAALGPSNNAAEGITNMALDYAPEAATQKGFQFEALNAGRWITMVQPLLSQPIGTTLSNHLNIGIPYENIDHIEVKKSLINPGLKIFLKDNSKLSYATFKKDRLDEISNLIRQFVAVN